MGKYINADELIDEIILNEEDVGIIGSKEVIDIIQNMPSADVVEVVRCKDCKYGIENGELCGRKVYLCSAMTNPNEFYGDSFCAEGKRREAE